MNVCTMSSHSRKLEILIMICYFCKTVLLKLKAASECYKYMYSYIRKEKSRYELVHFCSLKLLVNVANKCIQVPVYEEREVYNLNSFCGLHFIVHNVKLTYANPTLVP